MCVIKTEDLCAEERAAYESYMRAALEEARLCSESDDVPVGAVAVLDGRIVGRGRNAREKRRSPLWHAEMQACEEAASRLGRWNLSGVIIVATKEPCVMCAGLLVQSRISACVFAVSDKKGGGCGGNMQIACNPSLNHRVRLVSGVLESECLELLRGFFQKKRKIT